MQGSRVQTRGNWKQSVIKSNPLESKIYGPSGELPNKFSPTRLKTQVVPSRSLIKHKPNNYSQDEININDLGENLTEKDKTLKRQATIKTPRSVVGQDQLPRQAMRQGISSQKSVQFQPLRFNNRNNFTRDQQLSLIQELKLEFLRFKERVLKQLKRQEDEFKGAIQLINQRIGEAKLGSLSPIHSSSPQTLKFSNISQQFQSFSSPISKFLQALSKPMDAPRISISKQSSTKAISKNSYQSLTPQIKEKVSKFEEIIHSMKQDLNTIYQSRVIESGIDAH